MKDHALQSSSFEDDDLSMQALDETRHRYHRVVEDEFRFQSEEAVELQLPTTSAAQQRHEDKGFSLA